MIRINKYYGDEKIHSMKDLSDILSIRKSEIKNSVKSFGIRPTIVENRVWYFSESNLIDYIEFLISKENLNLLKLRINKKQNEGN